MPLFVGKQLIGSDITSSVQLLQNFPKLKERSREFLLQERRTFEDQKVLYIDQAEYGTVYPSDSFVEVVGSDSATTCQIVVLRHKGTGACSLAHFDGTGIRDALKEMVESLQQHTPDNNDNGMEMHIVGGFLDNRNISENVFKKILRGACNLPVNVELVCACVCELNDNIVDKQHVPIIYGIGVVVSSGQVIPVQQFQCQIPDEILRRVARYKNKNVVQVYNPAAQEIIIKPFDFHGLPARTGILKLSDEEILQSYSTSPHCEPENFVEKIRKVFNFLAENQNKQQTFFPHGKPRRFKPDSSGSWRLVQDNT